MNFFMRILSNINSSLALFQTYLHVVCNCQSVLSSSVQIMHIFIILNTQKTKKLQRNYKLYYFIDSGC